jgi:deoxyribodipyrimidine photo-lyase
LAAAWARIAALQPSEYARTRNALEGAVSQLSPYITHGLVSLSEVHAGVAENHALHHSDKFVFELGWRAYFRHVWSHLGDKIFASIHAGPLPDTAYQSTVPEDIRQACTGVNAIDLAIQGLYDTGYMHNHARMWLASYMVHLRKIHWRAGADWLYGHLLDGDLASNHLSWQWVAGTHSHQPYVFNAENVARFAPAPWHSPGSVIDTTYEHLKEMAQQATVYGQPPSSPRLDRPMTVEPPVFHAPPKSLTWAAPDAELAVGRDVWLVHPWSLGPLPTDWDEHTLVIGISVAEFHQAWPWSEKRWQFVGRRMSEITALHWHGSAHEIQAALRQARRVRCIAEPHVATWFEPWVQCLKPTELFPAVKPLCASFAQWWKRARA